MIWLLIVWNVLLPAFMVVDSRRDARWAREHLDLNHCAWAGPSGPYTRICLPKEGCWISTREGAVICYRNSGLILPNPEP